MIQEKGKWREICEAMVRELDPAKMSELAAQLLAALDEQKVGAAPSGAKLSQGESPKSKPHDTSGRSRFRLHFHR